MAVFLTQDFLLLYSSLNHPTTSRTTHVTDTTSLNRIEYYYKTVIIIKCWLEMEADGNDSPQHVGVLLPPRALHVTLRTSNGLGTKQCVLILLLLPSIASATA